jgi:hypothetical protein
MNVVLSQKLLEDSVGKFYSFVGLQTTGCRPDSKMVFPDLSFSEITREYLDKTSIYVNKYLNPLL